MLGPLEDWDWALASASCLRLTVARLREQLAEAEKNLAVRPRPGQSPGCLCAGGKDQPYCAWCSGMTSDNVGKIASLESELTASRAALAAHESCIAENEAAFSAALDQCLARAEKAEAALAEKHAALRALRYALDSDNQVIDLNAALELCDRALSEHPPAPAPKEGK